MKTYILNPTMTLNTITTLENPDKPAIAPGSAQDRAILKVIGAIAPEVPASPGPRIAAANG